MYFLYDFSKNLQKMRQYAVMIAKQGSAKAIINRNCFGELPSGDGSMLHDPDLEKSRIYYNRRGKAE